MFRSTLPKKSPTRERGVARLARFAEEARGGLVTALAGALTPLGRGVKPRAARLRDRVKPIVRVLSPIVVRLGDAQHLAQLKKVGLR
jgi:hypothetical protein